MGLIVLPVDTDGNVLAGLAPLTQVRSVRVTQRLSRAGSIEIEAAAPARGSGGLMAVGTRIRVESDHSGVREAVVEGRLVGYTQRFDGAGGVIQAEADDLLGELRDRLVDGLLLAEDGLFTSTYAEQHRAGTGTIEEIVAGTPVTLTVVSGDYLYIGYEERFDAFVLDIDAPAPSGWTLTTQYFRRDDAGANGWDALDTDGGIIGHGTAVIFWVRPVDWVQSMHAGRSLYWVRVQIAGDGDLILGSNNVRVRSWTGQTTGVVGDILAHAPAGWSVSGSYYDTPERGILHQFAEDTVLDALNFIAEQTGEHFRLAASGRVIEWLRTTAPESGVQGVPRMGATADSDTAFVVTHVERSVENGIVPTRVRPYGAGQGTARLTLARSTWTPPESEPPQYSIDRANNWLIDGQAEALGDRVEVALNFSMIGGVDNGQSAAAANELAQTAFVLFTRMQNPVTSWRIGGSVPRSPLRPGDRVRLMGIRDAGSSEPAVSWNFDGALYVMERTTTFDADGSVTMDLVCNSQRFYPLTDEELLARNVTDVVRGRRRAQGIAASAVVGAYVQAG